MTPFQRACVVAFWARINHGAGSIDYAEALAEMERHRPPKIHGQRHVAGAREPEHLAATNKPLSAHPSAGQLSRTRTVLR